MRCKVGDLAVIVSSAPRYAGWLVKVLEAAPSGSFFLPDGHNHLPTKHSDWVIESLSGEFTVPYDRAGITGTRETRYAAVGDKWLRPIRDNDGADETLTWRVLATDPA